MQRYGWEWYKNLPEGEKQKLVEYRKNIIKWAKTSDYNYKTIILKNHYLKKTFGEEYKYVLRNQFWS